MICYVTYHLEDGTVVSECPTDEEVRYVKMANLQASPRKWLRNKLTKTRYQALVCPYADQGFWEEIAQDEVH